ncbi:type II 3-dehydroquinate dehydratase [Limnochorda pilosa]|uniref:3-dehydroquinate dehydratase n=1 Tax=Limnochorda pilosa TaxID=1555112 RepID=A0A0K2SL94_LIMPI|nr:type II 3-dehydroquinate dehydratase [Limnochorda pilosa]BAS27767.1 3-dehydroquinate dehydratase [Limnochorda pilosa]
MNERILVVNGPNLSRLGRREPDLYGRESLEDVQRRLERRAQALNCQVTFVQSNHEGALIDAIQAAEETHEGIILNPGAYGHTSIALRDCLAGSPLPAVEVHLTNIHAREPFRHRLLTAPVCLGVVAGLGPLGYELALEALVAHVRSRHAS